MTIEKLDVQKNQLVRMRDILETCPSIKELILGNCLNNCRRKQDLRNRHS
jgi:hypothetical protein